jgi:hypothetical protein
MKNKQQLKMIKGLLLTITTLSLLLTSKPVFAQRPLWRTAFYLSSIYHHNNKTDTLTGTAFLIADNDKVYLVTAKHLIRASISGANQQLINDNIFISSSTNINDLGMPFASVDNNNNPLKPYILSSDNEDIAIISLQKDAYKNILNMIKSEGFVPLSISSVEAINSSSIGGNQMFFPLTWNTFKSAESKQKIRQQGMFKAFILSVNNDLSSIQIKTSYYQGNDGAPLLTGENKLVGMIIGSDVYADNAAILKDPYKTAKSAKVVTASQIFLQLKKLQEIELWPNFNN